ncbi:MAG: MFS transporter [Chlamydiae bacterium]|nr:MFS transporter [Chlamydiota bacterium]
MKLRGWISCLIISLFFAYELVQLHMLNAISSKVMGDLHLSTTDFSALCSTYLLADVIFLIPAGILLDRIRVRTAVLSALALCIIGTFGFAMSTSLLQACAFHFLSGIGNAFCFLSCMILASSWFGKKSSFVMSIMITIGLLGGVLAQVPFSLVTEYVGWRQTLVFDGIIGCVILALNALFTKENPASLYKERTALDFSFLRHAFMNRQVWKCGLYTGFLNLPLMIISAMIGNLYLQNALGFNTLEASLVTSMISLGTIVGSPVYGFCSDFFRKKKVWMILGSILSLSSFFLIWIVQAPSVTTMAWLFFALGFFSASQVLGYPMITDSAPPERRGTSMGLAALIIMGLAFVGQPLTGLLIDLASSAEGYSFSYALMLFPIGFVISLGMALSLQEKTEPAWQKT